MINNHDNKNMLWGQKRIKSKHVYKEELSMSIKTVMVLGAGFMGSGISQVSAAADYKVLFWNRRIESLNKSMEEMESSLTRRVKSGKMTQEEKDKIFSNITLTTDLSVAKDADLVIETVIEDKEIKMDLFKKLDEICPENTIFASNTSAISISTLATSCDRADRFIGLHFFSPVPVMKLVEVVKALKVSEETCKTCMDYVTKVGKTGIFVKDSPGFLINRILHAFRNEVFNCLEEGVASIEDIDTAVKLGLRHPLGPFELNDFAGLDIGVATAETLYDNFKEPKWRPNLTMKKLVEAGETGRKSGKGWYDYTSGQQEVRKDINLR